MGKQWKGFWEKIHILNFSRFILAASLLNSAGLAYFPQRIGALCDLVLIFSRLFCLIHRHISLRKQWAVTFFYCSIDCHTNTAAYLQLLPIPAMIYLSGSIADILCFHFRLIKIGMLHKYQKLISANSAHHITATKQFLNLLSHCD